MEKTNPAASGEDTCRVLIVYYSRFGAEGVSAATTQAVVNTSVLILVWDYVVTSFVF